MFGEVENEGGFRVMGYDLPGATGGSDVSVGAAHREDCVTITDQPFFISARVEHPGDIQNHRDNLSAGRVNH